MSKPRLRFSQRRRANQRLHRNRSPQPAATDTVKISTVAKALQEQTQAPAQTVKAAAPGDVQAKALLAKPAAAQTTTK